jgi:predicted nucleic acid-binding Zn ribbon protein
VSESEPGQPAGGAATPAAKRRAGSEAKAGEGKGGGEPTGPELARAVLEAALARRPAPGRRRGGRGTASGGRDGDESGGTGGGSAAGRQGARRWSGPGPDRRDPQPFGAVLAKLVADRGWQQPAAEATVFGRWAQVVGADVAEHSRPVKLEDGVLTVEAVSTAWATQLRLLAGSLLKRIAGEVGHGVVTRLHVHGPAAPSWDRGPRRVRGRGPRDTYG